MIETPIGFVGAVAAVNIFMQILKGIDEEQKLNRYYPLVAELGGVVLGLAIGLGWFESLFVGASAMGIYRGTKVALMGK